MLSTLLAPKNIPAWKPDTGSGVVVQPEAEIPPVEIVGSSPLQTPTEPRSVEPIETVGLEAAQTVLQNNPVPPLLFRPELLQDPLTAQPVVLQMMLGEVQRQKLQIEATTAALKQLPKKNLLSAFRLTQLLTLDRVVAEVNKFIQKKTAKLGDSAPTTVLTVAVPEPPVAVAAAGELARIAYASMVAQVAPPPAYYFATSSLVLAGKNELLAERMIELFSVMITQELASSLLQVSFLGLEKIVTDSTEMLAELMAFAAHDQLRTVARVDALARLSDVSNTIIGLATDYRRDTGIDYDSREGLE